MENSELILITDKHYSPAREKRCEMIYEVDKDGQNVVHHYIEIWQSEDEKLYVRNYTNRSDNNPVAVEVSQEKAETIMNAEPNEAFEMAKA